MTQQKFSAIIKTPIGSLGIKVTANEITRIEFLDNAHAQHTTDPFCLQVIKELKHYFTHPNHQFNLPVKLHGTPFQIKAWQAIKSIPSGQTASYGDIAKLLNTSPRAIGNACRTNPIPIIIPCHRVTAKHGLGGFSGTVVGEKISIKSYLLKHEKIIDL